MKELLNEIDGLQDGSLMAHADGSVNKVNKETREKIEDILNSYILDDLPSGMVSELSTLIQEEIEKAVEFRVGQDGILNRVRRDALMGFCRYLDENVVPFLDGRKIGFRSYIKEYLQSLDKGDTDENR